MSLTNGAAIGQIAPADWHGLRIVNILADYAQMRMRMSSSERSEVEAIRRDMYRDLGLDPQHQYARTSTGKVYKVDDLPKDEKRITVDTPVRS